jgi:hypothetical protein
MVIGWVIDAPAPVLEIVSVGADETTDVSVVGKFPDTPVPVAFTPGLAEVAGAALVVDETTDASSVGKRDCAALAVGDGDGDAAAIGDGSALSGVEPLC